MLMDYSRMSFMRMWKQALLTPACEAILTGNSKILKYPIKKERDGSQKIRKPSLV